MRARSMARVPLAHARRSPCPYHGGRPAIDRAIERIEQSNAYHAARRVKDIADRLLTGRPVPMEPCRTIAMAGDVGDSLRGCVAMRDEFARNRVRPQAMHDLRATMLALRWRRRFSDALRVYRSRPFFLGNVR